MTISAITNMSTLAKARLIEQFKASPNLNGMVEMFVEEIQEVEDAVIAVISELTLSTATGVNLDLFGEHLGRRRAGETDADYRDILRVQVGINTSDGAEQPLYDVFKLLTGSTVSVMTETFPAEIQLFGDGPTINASVIAQLQQIVAATVQINFLLSGGNRPFAFEGGEVLGGGFASIHDADPAVLGRGAFSSVIPGA